MIQASQPIRPASVGRTAMIIAGALIQGVVIFAGVAYFIGKGQPAQSPMISFIGAGTAAMMVVMRFILPTIIVNGAKAKLKEASDSDLMPQLANLYVTKTVVGMAVLEAGAFFNLVAYIVEKQFWSYGPVVFLLAVMAISFPSQGQFEGWAEEMKRELD